MALITIPGVPQKNTFQNYSINVPDLIALVTQTYFQDQTNWKKIILTYVSSVSNQISLISFTADELLTTLTSPGFFAEEARSSFQVSNITIYDKQNGRFRLERSQIPNVENYDLLFASAQTSTAFYGVNFKSGDSPASISFNASNPDELILAAYNPASWGGTTAFSPIISQSNGSFNSVESLKIMDSQIDNIYFNSDLTKAWVIGQLGTSCCGQALPPLPSGAEYGSNPFRLVEIDLVANTVSLKADIRQYSGAGGTGTYLGNENYTVIVDEANTTAVVTYGAYIAGYSLSTGGLLWFKLFTPIYDAYIGSTRPRLMDIDSVGFFIGASSYDGITETNNGGIVKASFTDGSRIVGYEATPSTANNKYSFWSCSPDKTKQVIPSQTSGANEQVVVYVNSDATIYNLTNPDGNYSSFAVYCTDSNFYLVNNSGQIYKYDYSGNFIAKVVNSSNWPAVTPPQFSSTAFAVNNGFIYCSDRNGEGIFKFNEATGANVPSFISPRANQSSGTFGKMTFFGTDNMSIDASSNNAAYYPYSISSSNTVPAAYSSSIVNYGTKELDSYISSSLPLVLNNGNTAMTSALFPNLIFFVDYNSGVKVYDRTQDPWVLQSGWPERRYVGSGFYGAAILGEYLYIGTGSQQPIYASDDAGNFDGTTICRININTKLIDRSFLPVLPNIASFAGDQAVFSETTDYVYYNTIGNYSGVSGLWRIKKSDSSVDEITYSELGLPVSFGIYIKRVVEIAPNTILMFPDKGTYNYSPSVSDYSTFGGKPYIVLSEDTLTPTGTQSTVTTDAPVRMVYNPNNGLLAGLVNFNSAGNLRFVSYEISTGARTMNSNTLNDINGNNYVTLQTVTPMTYEGENFLIFFTGAIIYGRKSYIGVVRMNPIGVMDN
jgi:hypothetical protein